ncbi:armadillo-type protein [Globomyces pollinis-pini]|nr:armadillo-type protein [Globomyces pollinis-pini]
MYNFISLTKKLSNALFLKLSEMYHSKSYSSKYIIICLGNLCVGLKSIQLLSKIWLLFYNALIIESDPINIISILKSLELLTNENKSLAQEITPKILPTLHSLLFKNNTIKWERKMESDSEFSDMDSIHPLKISNSQRYEWKIQIQSLICLQSLVKQCPKLIQPHWGKFLPSDIKIENTLGIIIRQHPNQLVRYEACKLISTFFNDSKYLAIASHDERKSAFTSLSQMLANYISFTLDFILRTLQNENDNELLHHLFNVLQTLLNHCDLKNLQNRCIPNIFTQVKNQLDQENDQFYQALDCLATLVDQLDISISESEEIIEYAISLVDKFKSDQNQNIQLALLHVICSVAKVSPTVVWQHWKSLSLYLENAISNPNQHICFSGLKSIEQFCHSLNQENVNIDYTVTWWTNVFEIISKNSIWVSESFAIRALGCTLLSHIPFSIFEEFPVRLKNFLIMTCMSFTEDEHEEVRANSCGTMGTFIINTTDVFLIDQAVTRLPILCRDKVLKVRIRAFWALGNLADHMYKQKTIILMDQRIGEDHANETILLPLFIDLLESSINGCKDHEKIRSHSMRALGFFYQILDDKILKRSKTLTISAINHVLKNITTGPFKNRWNACYCLHHMVSNPNFPMGPNYPYTKTIFDTLSNALIDSVNFKVKIACLKALSGPNYHQYQIETSSTFQTIYKIISTIKSSLMTLDVVLSKATYNEKSKYIQLFIDAIENSIIHFKIVLDVEWNSILDEMMDQISELMNPYGKPSELNLDDLDCLKIVDHVLND